MAFKLGAQRKSKTSSTHSSTGKKLQPKTSQASPQKNLSPNLSQNLSQKLNQSNTAENSAQLSDMIAHGAPEHKSSELTDIITRATLSNKQDLTDEQAVSKKPKSNILISAANDPLEQEADNVADKVVELSKYTNNTTTSDSSTNNSTGLTLETNASTSSDTGQSQNSISTKATNSTSLKPASLATQSHNKSQEEQLEEKQEQQSVSPKVQRAFMDFADSEEEEPISEQAPSAVAGEKAESEIQREAQDPERDKSKNQAQYASSDFAQNLNNSSGGSPLNDNTRSEMESGIGADFSRVKIHTDNQAAQLSQSINARAFTYGSHVYFNQGEYQPESSEGKHLLAHELYHTVQQGAAPTQTIQNKSENKNENPSHRHNQDRISRQPKKRVQRGWLGNAWNAVTDAASSAVEWAEGQLDKALGWAKEKFSSFVQKIPGYKLVSVILGKDPVTGEVIQRSGRNFIAAGLDIIPFGSDYQKKLESTGAMERAATWLDKNIAALDISLSAITSAIARFWRSLSLSDLSDISALLNRAANIVKPAVQKAYNFAKSIASKLLEFVKNAILGELVLFIKNKTTAYPLLTVILGKDPITDEKVERSGLNIIKGFLKLSKSGEEQLRQMEASGSLQKAANWIDTAVAKLNLTWQGIKSLFSKAWSLVTISNLIKPLTTFKKLANLFIAPAKRILAFVITVGRKVLEFIKEALINKLVAFARKIPGYPLLTVILGKDPFSLKKVARSPENIIHGFMSLIPGGTEKFNKMKETGAIAKASAWIEGAIATLNLTWKMIRNLFIKAWNTLSLKDLKAPTKAFTRIVNLFAAPIARLFNFIVAVLKKVIEIILSIMGFPTDLIVSIVSKAMQAMSDIKKDPLGFLINLLKAIKKGFSLFFDNIIKHLISGVTDWLLGQVKDAGIKPPKDFSLGSIFGFVLDVLGITAEKIWQKLSDKIGKEKVEKIRGMIDKLTGVWAFVKDVMVRGPIAIWEYIIEKISGLWNMVLDTVKSWIITKIINKAITKVMSMLDPTGIMAVINSTIAIYNAIESFIRYVKEMLMIVNSFVSGVAEIAKGNILTAAKFLEKSLAKAVPIVIGFLANQVGLGGIGKKIGEIIGKVRKKVDDGLTWLVNKAVNAGTSFITMAKSGVGMVKDKVISWWKKAKQFKTKKGEPHSIISDAKGKGISLTIKSDPINIQTFINNKRAATTDANKLAALSSIQAKYDSIKDIDYAAYKKDSETGDKSQQIANAQDEIATLIANNGLMDDGATEYPTPHISTTPDKIKHPDFAAINAVDASTLTPAEKLTEKQRLATVLSQETTVGTHSVGSLLSLKKGNLTGSQPASDANNPLFSSLYRSDRHWVKGHLMNHQLGGPGNSRNMTPITTALNNRMKSLYENQIKRYVLEQAKVVDYEVKVTHGTHSSFAKFHPQHYLSSNWNFKFKLKKFEASTNKWVDDATEWSKTDSDDLPHNPHTNAEIDTKIQAADAAKTVSAHRDFIQKQLDKLTSQISTLTSQSQQSYDDKPSAVSSMAIVTRLRGEIDDFKEKLNTEKTNLAKLETTYSNNPTQTNKGNRDRKQNRVTQLEGWISSRESKISTRLDEYNQSAQAFSRKINSDIQTRNNKQALHDNFTAQLAAAPTVDNDTNRRTLQGIRSALSQSM